jgi:hypothetical protein
MKKTISIVAIFAAIAGILPTVANATPNKAQKVKLSEPNPGGTIEVTNLGDQGDFLYLQIDLQQANNSLAILRILDAGGEGLHSETVYTKSFKRVVKIAPDEFNFIEIQYATANGTVRKKFDLNTVVYKSTKLVEVGE